MQDIVLPNNKSLNKDIQNFLKDIGVPYSFSNKKTLLSKVELFRKVVDFPWRNDQKVVINSFVEQKHKYHVVNGIFGCGKTTMILGIHVISILKRIYKPVDAMFISFNICIKNEIRQRLKSFGMSRSTMVRTFDSIIYEICKSYNYPYLDLPNFDGKRKFVYSKCKQIINGEESLKKLENTPKFIFIDECQDLETQTFIIFKIFFGDSQVIFTGDVFQSIQKEPKESLLWALLNNPQDNISKYHMRETPRVPVNILGNIKKSLQDYYPEFRDEIEEWKSSNLRTDTVIEWEKFANYRDIFKIIDDFLELYDHTDCMILTFSSAITVKGAMGDLARIRRYLSEKNIDVNKNHKKMDYDKLFLSTANSSKGLERNNILLISTFPLERAFINFSNDLVMNLITVGITRAKERVKFVIPNYIDKYSVSLKNFVDCPQPSRERIREGKFLEEFTYMDYFNMEHCATEIIRQNIVKYDTRIELKKSVKQFETRKLFDKNIPVPKIETEEERAFVGVLIENLITSHWLTTWPTLGDVEKLRNHPMYFHCFKRIEKLVHTYKRFVSGNQFSEKQFEGIYIYSQIHLGMYNKIFMDLPKTSKEKLYNYWLVLRPQIQNIKAEGDIKIQVNMKMPFATGICDVMITDKNKVTIWELKASIDNDWKDNAMFQEMLYALMTGKTKCNIVLLNPFKNEKCSYYFNMKNIMYLREQIINNLLSWNINCYLAKNIKCKGTALKVTDNYFLYMKERPENKGFYEQIVLIYFISPTKFDIIYNIYTQAETNKDKRSEMSRVEKLCKESNISEEEALKMVYEYLMGSQCKDSKIYYMGDCNITDSRFIDVRDIITKENSDILKITDDFEISGDAFFQSMLYISSMGKDYKLM
jgi:hypothetical protein